MKLGVVIVTYNRLNLLQECIGHCINQTISFDKIIVVNNCSTDGTSTYLEQFRKNEQFIICNQTVNRGGAGGFKIGLEIARLQDLDWVLIIDDDAIINLDYIEYCKTYITKHPNVHAVSGTVKTGGKIQTIHRRVIKNKLFHLESDVPLSAYKNSEFEYDLATFCGLMIDAYVLKRIGLPKDEYFIWYDDTEYSMRLMRYGRIVNISRAELDHRTSIPTENRKDFFGRMSWKSYYGHRNRLDAVRSHCGRGTQLIIIIEFLIFILCGLIMQLIPKYKKHGKYITNMLWDAMKDGYRGNLGKNERYISR